MASPQPPAFRNQARRGPVRRTPPAIFPPILGLLGLGLGWRQAAVVADLPAGPAEMALGAISLLYLFALVAYLRKLIRRPGVIVEELRVLPGRAGLAAANMGAMLLGAVLVPYAPVAALVVVVVAMVAHLALGLAVLWAWAFGPAEARVITPVWHLIFVGHIVAALALMPLGHAGVAQAILYATIAVAALIWAVGLWQLVTRIPPAPLRPLLAIHLAPAALFASVAAALGQDGLATGFAVAALVILVVLVGAGRWITASGFSALWGAFTFPLAATANALLATGMAATGLIVLAAATAVVLPIALRIMQGWARGGLAAQTNAAQA